MSQDNYQCLRCFYTTNKSSTMKSHINRKKKCDKHVDSLKYINYTDEEIIELSIIKISKRNNFKCDACNEGYATESFLNTHIEKYCKKIKNQDTIINNDNKINITNITNNNNNNNNIMNNIIINLPLVPFDKEWNIEHLDSYLKTVILLGENKFTNLLENILKNKLNLNVVLNNEINNAFVFKDNNYENIDKKDLFEKSMEKIYNHLNKIKEEFYNDSSIKSEYIYKEIDTIDDKYKKYKDDSQIKNKVHEYLSDIYHLNSEKAYEYYNEFVITNNNKIDGF